TVLEGKKEAVEADKRDTIYSYTNALANVLHTYLEVNDSHENQKEWVRYEEQLSFLDRPGHYAALLTDMLETLQSYLQEGSVSFVSPGMGIWANVFNAAKAVEAVPLGMPVEKHTVAWQALKQGSPEFAIHFNGSPKRISPRELYTEGATLAIPMLFKEQRKGVVLVYDNNPLLFKESVKHKLRNIVRLTALKMQTRLRKKQWEEDLL